MSNKYKCVQINLEESLYNHIKEYVDFLNNFSPKTDISYFCKCCLINRLIDIRVLDEMALPNPLCLPPKIDFSEVDLKFGEVIENVRKK